MATSVQVRCQACGRAYEAPVSHAIASLINRSECCAAPLDLATGPGADDGPPPPRDESPR